MVKIGQKMVNVVFECPLILTLDYLIREHALRNTKYMIGPLQFLGRKVKVLFTIDEKASYSLEK